MKEHFLYVEKGCSRWDCVSESFSSFRGRFVGPIQAGSTKKIVYVYIGNE